MAHIKQKLTPCLWFDTQAEEAAGIGRDLFAQFLDRLATQLRHNFGCVND